MQISQAPGAAKSRVLREEPSPVSIGRMGHVIERAATDYTAKFDRDRAFAFRDFLDAEYRSKLIAIADDAEFVPDSSLDRDNRLREAKPIVGLAVTTSLRHRAVLDWMERATGCGPLRSAYGKVLRMPADGWTFLDWHDDMDRDPLRRLGITIQLGTQDFSGGIFKLRRKADDAPVFKHRHAGCGSALIFSVGDAMEHRLSPVTEGGPRQTFTGWFTA